MAELQTITAAVTVAQLAWNACVFFRNVQKADSTARRLYQKTGQLHKIVQDVESVLRHRQGQRHSAAPSPNEIQTVSNVKASLDATRESLQEIDNLVRELSVGEEISLARSTIARIRLTLKQPAIARHESDIDTQSEALQTSLGVLQLFGHAETQSQLTVSHGEVLVSLAKLHKAIDRANKRLRSISRGSDGGPRTTSSISDMPGDTGEREDTDYSDAVKTLRDCISTAETIRGDFESMYDPDHKSVARFFDDLESESLADDRFGGSDSANPMSDDGTSLYAGADYRMNADDYLAYTHPDHDDPTPIEVLSGFIDDLRKQAQKDLEAGNPKRAEFNLIEAIKHADELEAGHETPIEDKIELQETLAIAYQKQKKWAEARKILRVLLQVQCKSEAGVAADNTVQRSRHLLLLATIHHEMYLAQPANPSPQESADLQAAERFARQSFNHRYKLQGTTTGLQNSDLLDTVQLLIKIHEAQGRTVLADSYRRQFMVTQPARFEIPDELIHSPCPTTIHDYDVVDTDEMLISAIKQRDSNQIQSLLGTANVNCRCSRDKTPLMYGVEQGDEITIRKLLDHGANVNATTASGLTALHQAVSRGNLQMTRLLLELDADIEVTDKKLATPLTKAVEKSHALIVSYLLGQGAVVHVKDKAGWSLLHHAAHNGAVDVLKHLLYPAHQINANEPCPAGKTALHYCAELALLGPAKTLIEHGADVEALDANSRSPLFLAASKPFNEKRERIVDLLLEHNAQVDPGRLPARLQDYPALQNHPSLVNISLSSMRRGSSSTMATLETTQSRGSFFRRLSIHTGGG